MMSEASQAEINFIRADKKPLTKILLKDYISFYYKWFPGLLLARGCPRLLNFYFLKQQKRDEWRSRKE